jgi:hypothetical protein
MRVLSVTAVFQFQPLGLSVAYDPASTRRLGLCSQEVYK